MSAADVFRRMLNTFMPNQPLQGDALERYYVERPHAPLEPMKEYLRSTDQHVKVLFGGHRGSGKSTELARLGEDVKDEFLVVPFSARKLNRQDLNHVDVALACASALLQRVTEKSTPVKVPRELLADVLTWLTSDIARETTITQAKSGSVAAKISALLVSLEGKYARETATRQTIRSRLDHRLSELIDRVNAVCGEIERGGPPPLIVFEDLDKIDLAVGRDLFFEHATTLTAMACRIVYTFPISLRYDNRYKQHMGDYSWAFLLPNISVCNRSGQPNPAARRALREVITRRVQAAAFGKQALDEIVQLSGGLMRDLIRIVAASALKALTAKSQKISLQIVRSVAAGMANDYRFVLKPPDYPALQELHRTKRIVSTQEVQDLLENHSLLEYRNDDDWCDAHPAVLPLLSEGGKGP